MVSLMPRMREKTSNVKLSDVKLDNLNMDIGTGNVALTNLYLNSIKNPRVDSVMADYDQDANKFKMNSNFIADTIVMSCDAFINVKHADHQSFRKDMVVDGPAVPTYTNLRFFVLFEFEVYKENEYNYLKLKNSTGSFLCHFGLDSSFNFRSRQKNKRFAGTNLLKI